MVLKRSRHDPQPGDLFLMNLLGSRWLLGRVIANDCRSDPFSDYDAVLLYIYDMKVNDPDSIRTPLRPKLLIPPDVTNRLGWTRGVFLHLRNEPLQASERLSRHVFRDSEMLPIERQNYDEYGKYTHGPLPGELSARCGLSSYPGIEESISQALGIAEKPAT